MTIGFNNLDKFSKLKDSSLTKGKLKQKTCNTGRSSKKGEEWMNKIEKDLVMLILDDDIGMDESFKSRF